jgi:hypothetical protein
MGTKPSIPQKLPFLWRFRKTIHPVMTKRRKMKMYQDLVSSFRTAPRDVHTVPTDGREPVWFYTYVQRGALYVESGRDHSPKSRISGRHRINEAEYEVMLNLYHRRKRGEAVSREASEATLCQVYWYGIFADLGL